MQPAFRQASSPDPIPAPRAPRVSRETRWRRHCHRDVRMAADALPAIDGPNWLCSRSHLALVPPLRLVTLHIGHRACRLRRQFWMPRRLASRFQVSRAGVLHLSPCPATTSRASPAAQLPALSQTLRFRDYFGLLAAQRRHGDFVLLRLPDAGTGDAISPGRDSTM